MSPLTLIQFRTKFDVHPKNDSFDLPEINALFIKEFQGLSAPDQEEVKSQIKSEAQSHFQALQEAIPLRERPAAEAERFAQICSSCHSLSIPLAYRWENRPLAYDVVREMLAFGRRTSVFESEEIQHDDVPNIVEFLTNRETDISLPPLEEEEEGEEEGVARGPLESKPDPALKLVMGRLRDSSYEIAKFLASKDKSALQTPLNQFVDAAGEIAFYPPKFNANHYLVYQAFSVNLQHSALILQEKIEAGDWAEADKLLAAILRQMNGAHAVFKEEGKLPEDIPPEREHEREATTYFVDAKARLDTIVASSAGVRLTPAASLFYKDWFRADIAFRAGAAVESKSSLGVASFRAKPSGRVADIEEKKEPLNFSLGLKQLKFTFALPSLRGLELALALREMNDNTLLYHQLEEPSGEKGPEPAGNNQEDYYTLMSMKAGPGAAISYTFFEDPNPFGWIQSVKVALYYQTSEPKESVHYFRAETSGRFNLLRPFPTAETLVGAYWAYRDNPNEPALEIHREEKGNTMGWGIYAHQDLLKSPRHQVRLQFAYANNSTAIEGIEQNDFQITEDRSSAHAALIWWWKIRYPFSAGIYLGASRHFFKESFGNIQGGEELTEGFLEGNIMLGLDSIGARLMAGLLHINTVDPETLTPKEILTPYLRLILNLDGTFLEN